MQKNRCPFFFFDDLWPSPSTLSSSDPSSSTLISPASASPISTSSMCEALLFTAPVASVRSGVPGAFAAPSGSDFCPATPAKLSLVGVLGHDSSALIGGGGRSGSLKAGFGVDGVGTLATGAASEVGRPVFTAEKEAICVAADGDDCWTADHRSCATSKTSLGCKRNEGRLSRSSPGCFPHSSCARAVAIRAAVI